MSNTPTFNSWMSMIKRCMSPNANGFRYWGGRGITVCERWQGPEGFENFLLDMGKRPSLEHTLDRIDNNGNYEPGNVRWATRLEQTRNRANNRTLTFGGETKCISEWAESLHMADDTLRSRIAHGWSVERALTTPAGVHRRSGA
jgi:hypothetical protein